MGVPGNRVAAGADGGPLSRGDCDGWRTVTWRPDGSRWGLYVTLLPPTCGHGAEAESPLVLIMLSSDGCLRDQVIECRL